MAGPPGSPDLARAKAALRAELRARLRELPPQARAAASEAAADRVLALPEVAAAESLVLFRSLPVEVATARLFEAAWAGGRTVHVPVVDGAGMSLRAVGPETRWHAGAFGVLEPEGEAVPPPAAAGLAILVPGLGFDPQGGRLGRGGGHYDRLLADPRLRGAPRVGLAFEAQIVPAVPREPHDARVDVVVTERRTLRPGG